MYIGDSKTLASTVMNTTTSTSTVNVTSIAISGEHASDFAQSSTCTALSVGSSCTVSVAFAPKMKGARVATLTVLTDATCNPTFTVPLTGNGVDTTALLAPTAADYGIQILSTASAAKVFTWINTSSVALAIASVNASGDYAVATTTCIGKIAANSSCTVSVKFTPIALGARAGTLTIVSASSLNGTLTASLAGVGVADVGTGIDALNFGRVDVGSRSPSQSITVTNYTKVAIALTGDIASGEYVETASTCSSTLGAGASCTVSVAFAPTVMGLRTGTLTVRTNQTKSSVILVALTGIGVDFAITVAPTSGTAIAGLGVSPVATLTPLGGFDAPVTMGCKTVATGTACHFASSGFTLSSPASDAFTITTKSQYTVIGYSQLLLQPGRQSFLLTLLGMCGAVALLAARRRTVRTVLTLVLVTFALGAVSGCSGRIPDANTPYTAPGTYDILVTATDGTITRSALYSLKVTAN